MENFRRLWDSGHDPTELLLQESQRVSVAFWVQRVAMVVGLCEEPGGGHAAGGPEARVPAETLAVVRDRLKTMVR